MLKGIHPCISPELLVALHQMGHGDEIVLADAHFPGHSMNENIIRADGLAVTTLLEGILPLFELDQYVDTPVFMMAAVPGDELDPEVEQAYLNSIRQSNTNFSQIDREERFTFYERAKRAFAVVMTGETRKYGNIILKKGVTPL